MDIKEEIITNVRSQMVAGGLIEKISNLANSLISDQSKTRERLSGAMEVLSKLYLESTGRDLQTDLNKDPSFKEPIQKAASEAEIIIAKRFSELIQNHAGDRVQDAVNINSMPTVHVDDAPQKPQLRRVDSNKKIEEDNTTVKTRTQQPVKVVIDDQPPGPGSGDEDDD